MLANTTLRIVNDEILELEEHFNLTLIIPNVSLAIGVQEGVLTFAIGKILNDDSKYCSCFINYGWMVMCHKASVLSKQLYCNCFAHLCIAH